MPQTFRAKGIFKYSLGLSSFGLKKKNMNMEPLNQQSLERVVSQKALQIGSSFPCQICVVGFLSGVCLTSLFLALLTSLGTFEFGGIHSLHLSGKFSIEFFKFWVYQYSCKCGLQI
ncbi:hypothetical protein NC652_040391 [Populus alba x Populus x berolinensis]|nr:hypothetical protein NC652_040391 [Populus alba x Populus x berolinensis]